MHMVFMDSTSGGILGLPQTSLTLWISAVIYVFSMIVIRLPLRDKNNPLVLSFFSFLAGMAIFHLLLGAGHYFHSTQLVHAGIFFVLTGSAFMVRFPLSNHPKFEKAGFGAMLLIAWSISLLLIIYPHHSETVMSMAVFAYLMIAAGFSGGYMIIQGLSCTEIWMKIKAVGGGIGLIICAFMANIFVFFSGFSLIPALLVILAPMILLCSVLMGRRAQKISENNTACQETSTGSAK